MRIEIAARITGAGAQIFDAPMRERHMSFRSWLAV